MTKINTGNRSGLVDKTRYRTHAISEIPADILRPSVTPVAVLNILNISKVRTQFQRFSKIGYIFRTCTLIVYTT